MPAPQLGTVHVSNPLAHRHYGWNVDPVKFRCQSGQASFAWGASPQSATLIYVTTAQPVPVGAAVQFDLLGHSFYGVCESDEPLTSSQGSKREVKLVDNRHWLRSDRVYGSFNLPDDTIVSGVRVRRYRHVLPRNFNTLTHNYTTRPYTARQIIAALMTSPTTQDRWACVFHADQDLPLGKQFDFLSGESLASALQQVSDAQGLTFSLQGGPFRLVWGRRGEGTLPSFPAASNERYAGLSLSGNSTRVRILGDRNLYQVHDISMVPDWDSDWEQFWDPLKFIENIYQVGKTKQPLTLQTASGNSKTYPIGTVFKTIGDDTTGGEYYDPEQMVSRQLARAEANEITVSEYAALVSNPNFLDTRKYAGRSRCDMPAMLYLRQILFRAFAFPADFSIRNAYGLIIPLHSLAVAPKMVAKVSHDPVSGVMSWDASENADGNGYAIVQGYQVGSDLFRTINPERFNFTQWSNAQEIWEHTEFQVDDSGDLDGAYILFDQPIIKTSDLLEDPNATGNEALNGHVVFKANPTFSIPPVRLGICLQGERFSYIQGVSGFDDTENVPGLNAEFAGSWLANAPVPVEIPFSDGLLAMEKASIIADSLLSGQWYYDKGSFTHWLEPNGQGVYPAGTVLTPMMDRIVVDMSPGGQSERIELTTEFPRNVYTPEHDLDRGEMQKTLLPGQAELRHEARAYRQVAYALRGDPNARNGTTDAFHQIIGTEDPPAIIPVYSETPVAGIPAGTPMRKKPTAVTNGRSAWTRYVPGSAATSEETIFGGVTARNNEAIPAGGGEILVHTSGDILARVEGPVRAGDVLGMVDGENHLKPSETNPVGKALQAITEAVVRLIKVRTSSASAASAAHPFKIVKVSDTEAKVSLGYCLKSLDAKDKIKIWGLEETFSIGKEFVIFLEFLFDKNLVPFLASLCAFDGGWEAGIYPKLVKNVRKADNANEVILLDTEFATHVGVTPEENAANKAIAVTKLTEFATASGNFRCFKTFIVIGYASTSEEATGTEFIDSGVTYKMVQSLNTNLLLADFCNNGIPCTLATPYYQPIMDILPDIEVGHRTFGTDLVSPNHPDAKIYYTLDGSEPDTTKTLFESTIPAQAPGVMGKARAYEYGWYPSAILDFVPQV